MTCFEFAYVSRHRLLLSLFLLLVVAVVKCESTCQFGSVNFVRTSNVRPLDSILEQITDKTRISSLRCHQRCIDSLQCTGYLYDRKESDCYLLTSDRLRLTHQNMIRSPDWSYHRRICLTTDSICSQAWAFESFGASQLHSIADKIMWNLNSEENCLNACSSERQFVCRSAIYDHANKSCSLHSSDRHSVPDMLAAAESLAANNLLYMENHCIQQGCEIWRTHFEMNAGYRMTGRRPFKRMYNHQPGQCIQMCKQDESCRFLSIDYLSGICEFFDDPQQNEQLVANLLGLGSRLSKRSVDLLVGSDRRPEEVGRRIVARLNVSDLNLESEFPPLDDASLDDIGPDGETITFLPEPAANPFPILEHTGTSTVLPMNSTQSTSHSISTSTSRPPTEPSTTTYSSVSITATESSVTTTHRIPITITSVASTTHVTSKPISVATTSAHTASSSTPTSTAVTIHQTNPPQLSTIATTSKASTATLTSTSIKMPVQTSTSPSIALTSSKPSTVTLSQTAYPNTSQSTMRPTVTSTTSAQPTTPSSVPESQQISISPNRPEMNGDLEPCSHCAHFTKVCLSELNSCGTDWTFEVNSGFTLKAMPNSPSAESGHFLAERIVSNVINRADCQSECLKTNRLQTDRLPSTIGSNASTDSFVCRSAVFDPTNRSCRLLSYTRHSTYGRFARLVPTPDVEYMENNCLAAERGFCTWKSQRRLRLQFADRVSRESNLTACQDRCTSTSSFYCRSISFEPSSGVCALSHHSGRSLSDQRLMLKASPDAFFSEIGNCFSVSVSCGATEMTAKVTSLALFQGRVYARDRPTTCSVDVHNATEFHLPIQLTGSECATKLVPEADFTNVLVIQANDQVLTAVDKAIGLKCSYNVHNITGEAVLQFSELDLTDQSRSSAALPELSLHITDLLGIDRDEVNLGELLKVQVRLSDEDTYGIFVRNLIARDAQGNQNLTLIDQSGCPAHSKLMREMRTLGSGSKQLESYFEAFSFTGSPHLSLEAEVETCLDTCRPVQCQVATVRSEEYDDLETVVSFGRRRRRKRESHVLGSKKVSQLLKVRSARLGIGSSASDRLIRKSPLSTQSVPVPIDGDADPLSDLPESSWTRTGIAQINSFGHFCFGFSSLAIFSGFTMLLQCLFFLIAMIAIARIKNSRSDHFPTSRLSHRLEHSLH